MARLLALKNNFNIGRALLVSVLISSLDWLPLLESVELGSVLVDDGLGLDLNRLKQRFRCTKAP